jgi:hypothetical protein
VCVIGRDAGCSDAPPFSQNYHRVEGRFKAPPFGGFTSYEVQRKRAGAGDSTFITVGTTTTNSFIDPTELADATVYIYRVRGLAPDGNSEWSTNAAPITATNVAPQAQNDGPFVVVIGNRAKRDFAVQTELLGNDTDSDSPTAYLARKIKTFSQGAHGTVTINSSGTILTYTPTSRSYTGPDSFTYQSDDGMSSDAPPVSLSGPSNQVTVSLTLTR